MYFEGTAGPRSHEWFAVSTTWGRCSVEHPMDWNWKGPVKNSSRSTRSLTGDHGRHAVESASSLLDGRDSDLRNHAGR